MTPIRRDYRFSLPEDQIRNWHDGGPEVTQFFNALSIFFPVGERFFISAVRHYRDQVADPELKKAITAFIGQEALHGREHESFNGSMKNAGLPAKSLETAAEMLLSTIQKTTPMAWQLAVTMALEHFTATYAGRLLEQRELLDRAEPAYQKLWLWHALEETEHKAVAFDVWRATRQPGMSEYALRASSMLVTTALFTTLVGVFTVAMIEAERKDRPRRSRWKQYAALGRFLCGPTGFFRGSGVLLKDYFRRDFHPWHHDNRALLQRLEELNSATSRLQAAA